MIKKLVALLSGISLVACSPLPVSAKDYEHDSTSVVRIDCGGTMGTGVRITETMFITAQHVISTLDCMVDNRPIKVTYNNPVSDFAMFMVPGDNQLIGISPVSCKPYKVDEVYVAEGYGDAFYFARQEPWRATKLVVEGMRAFIGSGARGMSGGPVYDESGGVRGIVNKQWPFRSLSLMDTPVCRR